MTNDFYIKLHDGAHCAALDGDTELAIKVCRGVIGKSPNTSESNEALKYLTSKDINTFTNQNPDGKILNVY